MRKEAFSRIDNAISRCYRDNVQRWGLAERKTWHLTRAVWTLSSSGKHLFPSKAWGCFRMDIRDIKAVPFCEWVGEGDLSLPVIPGIIFHNWKAVSSLCDTLFLAIKMKNAFLSLRIVWLKKKDTSHLPSSFGFQIQIVHFITEPRWMLSFPGGHCSEIHKQELLMP